MNEKLKIWLDKEMAIMQNEIDELNKKIMKKVPLWMGLSIGIMIAIGLIAGYDFKYILKVHFLIGCIIAAFIWLCFFIQTKTTKIKPVKKSYEKAFEELDEKEIDIFLNQMEENKYDVKMFQNPTSDKYPARLIVGNHFWFYYRFPKCTIVRTSDVNKIYLRRDTTNVSYNIGNRNVHQNMLIGMSLIISSKTNKEDIELLLGNESQVDEAKELIKKYLKDDDLFQ